MPTIFRKINFDPEVECFYLLRFLMFTACLTSKISPSLALASHLAMGLNVSATSGLLKALSDDSAATFSISGFGNYFHRRHMPARW